MVGTELLAEADHPEVILDHRLPSGWIFEMGIAPARTARDGDEVDADFVDSTLESRSVVRIKLAQCRGESFHPVKPDFAGLAKAGEGIVLPATRWCSRIGRVSDLVSRRVGAEDLMESRRG